jgi:hypothetical protein
MRPERMWWTSETRAVPYIREDAAASANDVEAKTPVRLLDALPSARQVLSLLALLQKSTNTDAGDGPLGHDSRTVPQIPVEKYEY